LVIAGLLWIYAVFELFTPYDGGDGHCSPPFIRGQDSVYSQYDTDSQNDLYGHDDHGKAVGCAAHRDWPKPVAALVVSLPLTAVGASLMTAGTVGARLQNLMKELEQARS
jgi:hypothetical protein